MRQDEIIAGNIEIIETLFDPFHFDGIGDEDLKFHSDLNWIAEAVRKFCEVKVEGFDNKENQSWLLKHQYSLLKWPLMAEPIEIFEFLVDGCKFLKENQTTNSES